MSFEKSLNGWVFIDKPEGITSFDVIRKVRNFTKIKKVAHVYHRLSNMQNQDKMKKCRKDRSAIPATQFGRVG